MVGEQFNDFMLGGASLSDIKGMQINVPGSPKDDTNIKSCTNAEN